MPPDPFAGDPDDPAHLLGDDGDEPGQPMSDEERTELLNDLEREFFGFSVREGIVVRDHPEYWSIPEGESLLFVRRDE